jgi:hypothetical protein
MADEQELTPEEKLLEVIQKGETPQDEAPTASTGLTLGDESDGRPVSRSSASGSGPFRSRPLFHLLVLLIFALLCVSGYEIYRNLPKPEKVYSEADINLPDHGDLLVLASLSDTLDMFSRRRILGRIPRPYVAPTNGHNIEELKGWRALVRDNWKFLGTSSVQQKTDSGEMESVREAIIMDMKDGKMHFLTTGQTIVLTKQDVRVDSIDETKVELVSGEETLTVK